MNLSICINTYYGTNIYKFRRLLASLFVEPDYEPYLKYIDKYIKLLSRLDSGDNFETIVNIINAWFKDGINGNCMRYGNDVMVKLKNRDLLIPMDDKLITFMMLITDCRSVFSTIKCDRSVDAKHIYTYTPELEFNLILSLQAIIVKKYIDLNKEFETIQEYITDLLQHNFKLTNIKDLTNENITFTFMIDSYSGIKYESFERFYAMLPRDLFEIIKDKYRLNVKYEDFKNENNKEKLIIKSKSESNIQIEEKLITKSESESNIHIEKTNNISEDREYIKDKIRDYFDNEYQNNYSEDSIKQLHNTIMEFSNFIPFRIFISGTKYKTTVQINRNIFMAHHIDKFIQFLDDDDFSAGLFTRYEYSVRSANKAIEYFEKNKKELIEIIEKGDKRINTKELKKLNYFDFRSFIYHYFSNEIKSIKKGKINYEKLVEIKSKYKERLSYLKELFTKMTYYDIINCLTINLKSQKIIHMSGFWEYIIMPYTLNNYSKIEHMVGEDCVYMLLRSGNKKIIHEDNIRPCYYYLEPSTSNGDIVDSNVNQFFKCVYNSMLFSEPENIKEHIYGKEMINHFYNYDSVVEMCDDSLEFVSHRYDREINIEDIVDSFKWNTERYNETIDNLY